MDEMQPPRDLPPDDGPLAGRDGRGRFAAGNKVSKGRIPGARCKATQAAERLFTANIEAVARKVIAAGKRGEPWAAKLIVHSVCPPPRGRPTPFPMPAIRGAGDIPQVLIAVMTRVAEGAMTADEAASVASVLDALRQSFEVDALTADVERLKAQAAEAAPAVH
jgi:hypothetical protein